MSGVPAWGPGRGIVANFDLALNGLSALDYFVRQSISGIGDAVLQKRIFVRLSQWLACWRAAVEINAGVASAHIATLSQLEASFSDDRNPLMHTERAPAPPLVRVQQQLVAAYLSLRALADDFGVCDAP